AALVVLGPREGGAEEDQQQEQELDDRHWGSSSESEGDAEQERALMVDGAGDEVRDARQALAAVGVRVLVGELEDDERNRTIREPDGDAIAPGLVGLERDEPAAAERRLLHEAVQPYLLAAQHRDELGVLELPAEEALGEEVGPEAIAEVEPVALLARRDVRELELDLALERRVLELRLLLARDPRQTRGDVLDAAEVREDVLALDL